MTTHPDAYEQMTLELINRARMDPLGEFDRFVSDASTKLGTTGEVTNAIRYFNVDLTLLQSQFDALVPVAPLAWNALLSLSASRHSQLMIDYDQQSHNLPNEPGIGARVMATGYDLSRVYENIFAYAQDPFYTHAAFFIDWGNGPGGIQAPAGHRDAIMSVVATEVGIAAIAEADPSTQVGPYAVTHHIATSWDYRAQLVGVVIDDRNGNDFYDLGEGRGGITVTATGAGGTFQTTTWDAGGYQMALAPGTYDVTFSGSGIAQSSTITIGRENVKLDAETGGAAAAVDDVFHSSTGNQTFDGNDGYDTVIFGGLRADHSIVRIAADSIVVTEPDGATNTLTSIEKLVFADRAYDMQVASKAASIPQNVLDSLVDLYVAYFNRVPEASGLSFWIDEYRAGASLDQIAARFYEAGITFSSVTGYSAGMSLQDFITTLYANVLDRQGTSAPTALEVDYWANLVATGNIEREGVVKQMLADAREFYGDPNVGYVPELLDSKVEFGKLHAVVYGLDYLSTDQAIRETVALADAIAPNSMAAAIAMVGLSANDYVT